MARSANRHPWTTGAVTAGIVLAVWFGVVERVVLRPSVTSTLLGLATAALAGLGVVLRLVINRSTASQAGSLVADESAVSIPKGAPQSFDDPSEPGDASHRG